MAPTTKNGIPRKTRSGKSDPVRLRYPYQSSRYFFGENPQIDLKSPPRRKKINVDNNANFCYSEHNSLRLNEPSKCWTATEAGTQVAVFA